jgi:glutamyl/glutaminyl-tRNA synthetase
MDVSFGVHCAQPFTLGFFPLCSPTRFCLNWAFQRLQFNRRLSFRYRQPTGLGNTRGMTVERASSNAPTQAGSVAADPGYRGRLAPSPTGYMHLGHARTFWTAWQRAQAHGGVTVLRNEDIDAVRCRRIFAEAMLEDLLWLGIRWQEGPDCGGPHAPYEQSRRLELYHRAFERLRDDGWLYPCVCSRQDVMRALSAPHAGDDEPVYPGTCRDKKLDRGSGAGSSHGDTRSAAAGSAPRINWRFRVPDGERVHFDDAACGAQEFRAGTDFGDFVVWRHDDLPSYQLAVVVDDASMQITDVVRGMDLLRSTARQLLLYRALRLQPPTFFHCPLMTDSAGNRLAKRHDALSLRQLRSEGRTPESLRRAWAMA